MKGPSAKQTLVDACDRWRCPPSEAGLFTNRKSSTERHVVSGLDGAKWSSHLRARLAATEKPEARAQSTVPGCVSNDTRLRLTVLSALTSLRARRAGGGL